MKNKGNKDKTTMPAREVAVLIEDLRSQFRIFGEQLKAVEERLGSRIERLENRVEGVATNQARTLERITSLEITSRKMQVDIAEIKETFKNHDKRIAHLEAVK